MPIGTDWSEATEAHVRENVPDRGGIYELKAAGELVYVGSASDLRERLLAHLSGREPDYYRYKTGGVLTSPTKMERDHLERYRNEEGELPRWNDGIP